MSAIVETPVEDPAAWRGEDMSRRDDWRLVLDAAQVAELDVALDAVEARGIDALDITELPDEPGVTRLAP